MDEISIKKKPTWVAVTMGNPRGNPVRHLAAAKQVTDSGKTQAVEMDEAQRRYAAATQAAAKRATRMLAAKQAVDMRAAKQAADMLAAKQAADMLAAKQAAEMLAAKPAAKQAADWGGTQAAERHEAPRRYATAAQKKEIYDLTASPADAKKQMSQMQVDVRFISTAGKMGIAHFTTFGEILECLKLANTENLFEVKRLLELGWYPYSLELQPTPVLTHTSKHTHSLFFKNTDKSVTHSQEFKFLVNQGIQTQEKKVSRYCYDP